MSLDLNDEYFSFFSLQNYKIILIYARKIAICAIFGLRFNVESLEFRGVESFGVKT
jgi:hypothetical protein